jgi:hypothetical protein
MRISEPSQEATPAGRAIFRLILAARADILRLRPARLRACKQQ